MERRKEKFTIDPEFKEGTLFELATPQVEVRERVIRPLGSVSLQEDEGKYQDGKTAAAHDDTLPAKGYEDYGKIHHYPNPHTTPNGLTFAQPAPIKDPVMLRGPRLREAEKAAE